MLAKSASMVEAAPSVREATGVPAASAANEAPDVSLYRDGTYTAAGRYLTPGGNESIRVRLQVRSGVIVSAVSETEASSPTAHQFQEQFRVSVAGQVVGRPLASVSVGVVAGASLTSTGFDDALARIRSQAQR